MSSPFLNANLLATPAQTATVGHNTKLWMGENATCGIAGEANRLKRKDLARATPATQETPVPYEAD